MEESDSDLVRKTRSGDLAAYAALMRRHGPRLKRYAQCLLGSHEEAEEALQDTFLRAHRAITEREAPRELDAWLFRILINRCRTRNGRADLVDRSFSAGLAYELSPTPPDVDGIGWRGEIERALARLPEAQREAFILKYVEDFSYEEIQQLTGVRMSALKMRVMRACEGLRELLRGAYDA
ncbi:MAG: RNA polymerase sigma factor [Gemmatimonadota bacterium]